MATSAIMAMLASLRQNMDIMQLKTKVSHIIHLHEL